MTVLTWIQTFVVLIVFFGFLLMDELKKMVLPMKKIAEVPIYVFVLMIIAFVFSIVSSFLYTYWFFKKRSEN